MRKILSAILIAFCLYNCSSDSDSPKTGDIYGVVTEKSSAEPMKATGVELYVRKFDFFGKEIETSLLLKTVTYDDGHYEFNELNPDRYKLKVVAENYNDVTYDVEVEAGRTARADMQLEKVETGLTVSIVELISKQDSALLKGKYSYKYNDQDATDFGFSYGTTAQSLSTKVTGIRNTNNLKEFSATIKDLKKGTYYVQAYTKNQYGTQVSEIAQLNVTGAPVVATLAVTNIDENTATVNGRVEYSGDPVYTEKGFVYSANFPNPTIDDPEDATTKVTMTGTSKEFSANIANLIKDKTYHVRAYITNEDGTEYGESVSFTTTSDVGYWILQSANLMVQKNDLSSDANWDTASNLCKSSTLGGYTDWHLPTRGELQEIYNNQNVIGKLYGEYWSKDVWDYRTSYYFHMDRNVAQYSGNYNKFKVRAVRSIGN